MARSLLVFFMLTAIGAIGPCPPAAAQAVAPEDSTAGPTGPPATPAPGHPNRGPIDYLWVPRTALIEPGSIDSVIARAVAVGVRGLLVQVVGRGDAYYRSDILPRAEALGPRSPEDPLADIVARASEAGLEVHAWVNCMLVWSAPQPPHDARHVVNAHPEWIAALRDGRSLGRVAPRERRRLGLEGVFLAPAHPAVGAWLASIAAEIASRYPVQGIHLDYIRLPGVPVGGDPTTRARFALQAGVDPSRVSAMGPRRAWLDSAWASFQREAVTSVVRQVRDSIRAVRPGIVLSAAVLSDPAQAERVCAQDWRAWLRDGIIERAFIMAYAPEVQTVLDQLLAHRSALGASDRLVPGIAVYNTGPASAAHKIKGAKALGFPAVALYAYDSLFDRPSRWPRLSALLGDLKAASSGAENPMQAARDSSANP